MLALHQRGNIDGFITNDVRILSSAREMVVFSRKRLGLVVTDGVGHDAMRATGLLMVHLAAIAASLTGEPRIFRLRPTQVQPITAGVQINRVATHRSIAPNLLITQELAEAGDLARPVL